LILISFPTYVRYKVEVKRDVREARQRAEDRRRLEQDIKLDERADRQLT